MGPNTRRLEREHLLNRRSISPTFYEQLDATFLAYLYICMLKVGHNFKFCVLVEFELLVYDLAIAPY